MEAVVLCYHNIVPDGTPRALGEAFLGVPNSVFTRQIRYLAARYRFRTFDGGPRDDRSQRTALVVTFDDGYRAVRDYAAPLLRDLGIPAYIFVNPAFVGGWHPRDRLMALALYGSARAVQAVEAFLGVRLPGGEPADRARRFLLVRRPMWRTIARRGEAALAEIETLFAQHGDERVWEGLSGSALLSWDDLRTLRGEGLRIGNHTQHHLELHALPADAVRREIREAQGALRGHVGADEPVIAYPRGKWSPGVQEEARRAGYRWGLLADPGRVHLDRPTLTAPRLVVSPGDGVLRLIWKMSRPRGWIRRSRRRERMGRGGWITLPQPGASGRAGG